MTNNSPARVRALKIGIWSVSILICLVVALLTKVRIEGYNTDFLPATYAMINGFTAIVLLAALVFIKQGKIRLHQISVQFALVLSLLFLVGYVLRHITSDPVSYGNKESVWYGVYLFVLITHVTLSITVIPLVLFTYLHAYLGDFKAHKRLAKITFPIWLYVAITGVVVYYMISPFY
jgi:putative membrane protein